MSLEIHNEVKTNLSFKELQRAVDVAFKVLKINGNVSVAIVSPKSIRKLNKAYRGINSPTDVLSFALDDYGVVGEVIICYDVARKQAKEEGISITSRVKRLLVHGIVHIAGYDHETDDDAIEMDKIEKVILSRI